MIKKILIIIATLYLAACSTTEPKPVKPAKPETTKLYSQKEYLKLTYCLGISDAVRHIAYMKLSNVPKAKAKERYQNRKNSRLLLATVDAVYASEFKNAWKRATSFYSACSVKLAKVSADRVWYGKFCLQQTHIGDVAYYSKRKGIPKSDVYQKFSKLKGRLPTKIIDRVYSLDGKRSTIKLDIWRNCMQKVVE